MLAALPHSSLLLLPPVHSYLYPSPAPEHAVKTSQFFNGSFQSVVIHLQALLLSSLDCQQLLKSSCMLLGFGQFCRHVTQLLVSYNVRATEYEPSYSNSDR